MKILNKASLTAVACTLGVVLVVAGAVWWPGGLGKTLRLGKSQAAAVALALATDDSVAVLAGSSITNIGSSVINGDLGLSPGTSVGGFPPGTVSGTQHVTDGVAAQAETDLTTAYNNAAGQTTTGAISADLAGQTLTPGVYTAPSSMGLSGALTLDAGGDPNAVFIFQAGSTLTTGSGSVVNLINGAQACNVFWQVGSSATLGTGSSFQGTILAADSATLTTGATVVGRVLAETGSVTMDTNTITVPGCSHPPALASLHVIKLVVNANGGTAVATDFSIHVKLSGSDVAGSPKAGTSTPGTSYSLAAGTYVVSEGAHVGYTQSFTGACDASGNVTLSVGTPQTCTIVNTDIPVPTATSGGNGATSDTGTRIVPLIGILKVPTPLALPSGPGLVTYNYTVWNVAGLQSLVNIGVTDDKCSPVQLVSGDLNKNAKLDPGEKWNYSCATTIATTTTNTAVVTGYSDDTYHQPTAATAAATVVVGASTPAPLINIVKVPSRLTPFPYGGGNVTYTYTVTNPGAVPMNNVSVTDNKCAPVSFVSGDANHNSLLEPGEVWTYTCGMNIPISTSNIATAEGSANGFTALAYAFATVLVSAPTLPNTGFPPRAEQK